MCVVVKEPGSMTQATLKKMSVNFLNTKSVIAKYYGILNSHILVSVERMFIIIRHITLIFVYNHTQVRILYRTEN